MGPEGLYLPSSHMVTKSYREANSPAMVPVPPTFVETMPLAAAGLSRQTERVQTTGGGTPQKRPDLKGLGLPG